MNNNINMNTQRQKLNQLIEQISSQEAQLNRLKALRESAKKQTAINAELSNQLSNVNKTINEKDGELRQALNRVDNLNRRLTRRTSKEVKKRLVAKDSGPENRNFITNGRRVSFDPLALLLDAALEGELDLVIQTSKQVADLNASHDECVTALHNAAVAGHYEVAKYLIEAGCDINVQDSDGWTPLHCAASCNNLPLVKLLIENGALIYATTTSDQLTPAMKCEQSEEGFKDCYNYLISVQNNLGVINNGKVFALYDYEAQEEDELSFTINEELTVIRRDDSDEQEWWWAQKRVCPSSDTVVELKEGYIPRNLVGLHPRCEAYLRHKNRNQKLQQTQQQHQQNNTTKPTINYQ
uniref:Apoptosis-stimulating of p53 protein 2 n=1 Tax=Aceria tosichella TaxID=561515 RepID=A0A6G1SKA7_9ACAR